MIKPMLATLVKEPFDDEDWVFEVKWDGYRALAHKTKKVALLSRNGISFNARFSLIAKELEKIPGKFIFDGEIVVIDKKGRSQFQLLQNYEEGQKERAYYYIFDILSYQGKDLSSRPLLERKELLRHLLASRSFLFLRFSEHVEKFGKRLFTQAKKKGLEGIIAKRKQSPYRSTRSRDWLKIKTKMRQEVVIGGFTEPRGARKYFGSLLIGVYSEGKLLYAGHVGGGFNEALLKTLYHQMIKLKRKKCPFQNEPKPNAPVTWIRPKLVCEVAFAEWTKEGVLRQPIFQGIRVDKSPQEVLREL